MSWEQEHPAPLPFGGLPLPFGRLPLPFGRLPLPFGRLPLPFGRLPLPFGGLPLPFGGPPNFIKRGKDIVRVLANYATFLVVNSYQDPPPPLSKLLYLPLGRRAYLLVDPAAVTTEIYLPFGGQGGFRGGILGVRTPLPVFFLFRVPPNFIKRGKNVVRMYVLRFSS